MLDPKILKHLEEKFLAQYPGGFDNTEMVKLGKKHKMDKMTATAKAFFTKSAFQDIDTVAANAITLISRASMVSMFEKPKLKDFVNGLPKEDKAFFVNALKQLLHGKQQNGFEAMVDILKTGKLAKWSLLTIIPAYYRADTEVFVKPTTAKDIISVFGIDSMVYKPLPTWDFYHAYRKLINEGKKHVDKTLSPSNAAFTGFLMMTMRNI